MERRAMLGSTWLFVLLAVMAGMPGCRQNSRVCSFRDIVAGKPQRSALIIAADTHNLATIAPLAGVSAEVERLRNALSSLQFSHDNICVLSGEEATLDNVRRAVSEFTQDRSTAMRFLYFTGYGSEVADINGDEPDERNETLVFFDANGAGRGELLDNELATWLRQLSDTADSSLAVINAGFRAHTTGGAADARYWQANPNRTVMGRANAGDSTAGVLAPGSWNHLAIARPADASSDRFARTIAANLSRAAGSPMTLSTLASAVAADEYVAGLQPQITGGGSEPICSSQQGCSRTVESGGATKVSLTLRDALAPGGIDSGVRSYFSSGTSLPEGVGLVDFAGDFELSRTSDGSFVLRGPDNRTRNRFTNLSELNDLLAGHLLQRRLLTLRSNGVSGLRDYSTLQVSLREARSQPPCARGSWDQAQGGAVQRIPLCHDWYVQVDLQHGAPALFLEVLVLSSDGTTYLLPHDGVVRATQSHSFDDPNQIFRAGPPIDGFDQVLVVGSTQQIDAQALKRGLLPALRNTSLVVGAATFQVVANDAFIEGSGVMAREYTIKQFDIRPYMPDEDNSAVARFLRVADSLAKASVSGGYGYKQHKWNKGTDAENLAEGIDCSRAIWFAFTRSGHAYNRDDRYLPTAEMVGSDSLMNDRFDRCELGGEYQLGDILVYRSSTHGDGHVVAVIDPEKRIAWGSHGWDGNVAAGLAKKMDIGVEYQKIKMKKDWQKWDRPDMQLRACWRNRAFARERAQGGSVPGNAILKEKCKC